MKRRKKSTSFLIQARGVLLLGRGLKRDVYFCLQVDGPINGWWWWGGGGGGGGGGGYYNRKFTVSRLE